MVLDTTNEAAGWGSNTNGSFSGIGHHIVTITWNVGTNAGGALTYKVEVANITDATIAAGQTFTTGVQTGAGTFSLALVFDGVAAKVYQPRLTLTTGSGGRKVTAISMTHAIAPIVLQNQRVRSDPGSLPTRSDVEALDSSGNMFIPLSATAVPFWLPPGLSIIYLNEFDTPPAGYLEGKSVIGRTMTATATVYPRFYS
jgi:hypothetical protein